MQNLNEKAAQGAAPLLRQQVSVPLMMLAVLFVTCIIIANLIEIKTIDLPAGFTVTAGMAVFPLSYIINDCVTEIYGFARARLVIWLGFAMSLMVALFLNLAIVLPGGADWQSQQAMEAVYGGVPRIMGASFAAFVCGSLVNAYVMARMKAAAPADKALGYRSFSARAIISTLWGEGVDSLVFFPCAFGGVLPWRVIVSLMVTQTLLKTLYEIIILPVTIRAVAALRRIENNGACQRKQATDRALG